MTLGITLYEPELETDVCLLSKSNRAVCAFIVSGSERQNSLVAFASRCRKGQGFFILNRL